MPYIPLNVQIDGNILIFGGGVQLCGLERRNLLTFEFLKATETSAHIVS